MFEGGEKEEEEEEEAVLVGGGWPNNSANNSGGRSSAICTRADGRQIIIGETGRSSSDSLEEPLLTLLALAGRCSFVSCVSSFVAVWRRSSLSLVCFSAVAALNMALLRYIVVLLVEGSMA